MCLLPSESSDKIATHLVIAVGIAKVGVAVDNYCFGGRIGDFLAATLDPLAGGLMGAAAKALGSHDAAPAEDL